MKYIINERQYKLLIEEEQEILQLPSINFFGGWGGLQHFLEKKGNPLYSIGGDLDLSYNDIESLGNLTSVGGNVSLFSCKNLTSLGNLTSVGGSLYLRDINIKSFGNLTSVGGDLYLYLKNTQFQKKYSEEEIRNMVEVGGNIYS
jgi:hypothetical protein